MSSFIRLASSLLLLLVTTCEGGILPAKVRMKISNDLENGLVLNLHCQSKDDDPGVHALSEGDEFEINFHPNYWGNTLFYCSMDWQGASHYYDIYNFLVDEKRCDPDCLWSVKEAGPCLFNHDLDGNYEICYAWKSVV